VIFLFSTREEIGLEGAEAARGSSAHPRVAVHAIDTFVSADSPLELRTSPSRGSAPAPWPRARQFLHHAARLRGLAGGARARRGVALQIGTTNGGNDGSTFTQFGVVDVAMGWPLRYSHSPVEVVDLKIS